MTLSVDHESGVWVLEDRGVEWDFEFSTSDIRSAAQLIDTLGAQFEIVFKQLELIFTDQTVMYKILFEGREEFGSYEKESKKKYPEASRKEWVWSGNDPI